MSTLVAFISSEDPFSHGLIAGLDKPGPLLRLLSTQAFSQLALLLPKGLEQQAAETLKAVEERFPNVNPCTQALSMVDPTDITHVITSLRSDIENCLNHLGKPAKAYVQTPKGMPEIQSALTLLKTTGTLNAELIELEDAPYFSNTSTNVKDSLQSLLTRIKGNTLCAAQSEAPFVDDLLKELNLIGEDPLFEKAISIAATLAEHDTPILIQGETGTGKDLFTRLIHRLSSRSNRPLTIINCATLPESLAESILFGHAKGAFSGATHDRIGKFEHANGGTLFLDELGELCPNNQSKLLRVIEDGIVEPLGSHDQRKVDVRVITATNKNLKEAVKEGRFREDLYYRLSVGECYLPALRERPRDIAKLALHFLGRINKSLKEPKQLSQESLEYLETLPFPGNIRDLRNTIERAAMLSRGSILNPEDLETVACPEQETELPPLCEGFSLEAYLGNLRKRIINKAISEAKNNKSLAARKLGVSPQAVHKFVKTEQTDTPAGNN